MTLGQQPAESGTPAPDSRHYPTVYHHSPSSMVLHGAAPPPPPHPQQQQQQQQVAGYLVAGPPGGHQGVLQGQPVTLQTPGPNHVYPSAASGPAAFQGSSLNQQLLQQHTYIQQPVQQVELSRNQLILVAVRGSHQCLDSYSSCLTDVHMLLLLCPPPPLLRPAAALQTPHQLSVL